MKIGDIVYLAEPTEWYKTPDFKEETIYPAGTPVIIIGPGFRGCRIYRNWSKNVRM